MAPNIDLRKIELSTAENRGFLMFERSKYEGNMVL